LERRSKGAVEECPPQAFRDTADFASTIWGFRPISFSK